MLVWMKRLFLTCRSGVFTYPTGGQDLCLRMFWLEFEVIDKCERIIKVDG
jgi:hypothetical protein